MILDAMVFLTVAAIVSVSLIAANSSHMEKGEELQGVVDDAHDVLLRTTLRTGEKGSMCGMSVYDMTIAYALSFEQERELTMFEEAFQEIEMLLQGLIPDHTKHSWMFTFNQTNIRVGHPGDESLEAWVSERRGEVPVLGQQIVLRLTVWR